MVGLLDALGEQTAVIAGHDWGAPVAWHAALLRPDRFRARHRAERAVPAARLRAPDHRRCRRPTTRSSTSSTSRSRAWPRPSSSATCAPRCAASLYSASGDARDADGGRATRAGRHGAAQRRVPRATCADPAALPPWLTEADVDFYTGEFARTGFRGGLNWYRNIDRNWELLAPFAGRAGHRPRALRRRRPRPGGGASAAWTSSSRISSSSCPTCAGRSCCPAAATGPSRSAPAEVNAAMLEFLRGL